MRDDHSHSFLLLVPHILSLHCPEPMVFQGEEIFQGLRGFTYGCVFEDVLSQLLLEMWT